MARPPCPQDPWIHPGTIRDPWIHPESIQDPWIRPGTMQPATFHYNLQLSARSRTQNKYMELGGRAGGRGSSVHPYVSGGTKPLSSAAFVMSI